MCFPNAVHLRCTNHFQQNVKDKLRSIGVVQSVWKEFLSDIFGAQVGYNYQKGLIDTDSSMSFTAALQKNGTIWNAAVSSRIIVLNFLIGSYGTKQMT